MRTAMTFFAAALGLLGGGASTARTPMLGHPWAPFQKGYGKPHPVTVSNGGDPTGIVQNIRWSSWGKGMAIGGGIATYVWPGTGVSSNGPTRGARVVAFHLGTCRGRPSYNAIEWYFPKYDETFNPRQYINACTGQYVGASPRTVRCRAVRIPNSNRTATDIEAIGMRCATTRRLIAATRVDRYLKSGGRFIRSGFRCGTEGDTSGLGFVLFECELDRRYFIYHVAT